MTIGRFYTIPLTILAVFIMCNPVHHGTADKILIWEKPLAIQKVQLREVIVDVISEMGKYSRESADLLMLTAATESHLGTYLFQRGGGPARGIFQMEEGRDVELIERYINRKAGKKDIDKFMILIAGNHRTLMTNIAYQVWIARWYYYQFSEKIPKESDYDDHFAYVEDLARYYKKYWNTALGAATIERTMEDYKRFVL